MDQEPRAVEHSSSAMTALIAFGIGAAAMYFLDPVSGRRRRALVRDQIVHLQHEIVDATQATAKDLRNRAQGMVAETRGAVERTLGKEEQVEPVSPQPRV